MKKIYIEPKAKEVNVRFETLMTVTSPGEIPGENGLSNDPLGVDDESLAKEQLWGW